MKNSENMAAEWHKFIQTSSKCTSRSTTQQTSVAFLAKTAQKLQLSRYFNLKNVTAKNTAQHNHHAHPPQCWPSSAFLNRRHVAPRQSTRPSLGRGWGGGTDLDSQAHFSIAVNWLYFLHHSDTSKTSFIGVWDGGARARVPKIRENIFWAIIM